MTLRRFPLLALLLGATALGPAYAQAPAAPKPATAKTTAKTTAKKTAAARPAPAAPVASIQPEDRARAMTDKMTQALGLTFEQSKRVQQINLQSIQRVEEARQTHIKDLPRMRAEIDRVGTSRLSLLKDVLTEQQFRSYAAMREKKMGIPEALKQQADAADQ